MYAYVCVCECVYLFVCLHMCLCVCVYACVCAHVHACLHMRVRMFWRSIKLASVGVRVYVKDAHMFVHVCMYVDLTLTTVVVLLNFCM